MENRTNKRHEPIVVFIAHSDSEELDKINHLNFQNLLPCPSLVCTLKSVHQKDKKTMTLCFSATLTNMFISVDILDKIWPDTPLELAAMGYYRVALHKTVPENRNTVTRLSLKVRRMKFLLHWEGILMRKLMPRN